MRGLQTLLAGTRLWFVQLRSLALIHGFWKALRQSLPNLFWWEMVWRLEVDLDAPVATVESPLPVVLEWVVEKTPQHWSGEEPLQKVRGDYGLAQFNMRLQRGDVACCASVEQQLVGWAWLKRPPVSGAGSRLADDVAYVYDVWVLEGYRGNRVSPLMLQSLFLYCRERLAAVHRVVIHSASWNKAAMAGQIRAGMQMTARELSVVAFGLRKNWMLEKIVH